MPGEESPTKIVASGISSIFERIGEFFHIFDLSFFVAGAITFGALVFTVANLVYYKLAVIRPLPFDGWVWGLAIIVGCYACGLVAFAGGRCIAEFRFMGGFFRTRVLGTVLISAIEDHEIQDNRVLKPYVDKIKSLEGKASKNPWWAFWRRDACDQIRQRLYVRMWSEVAHDTRCAPLFVHHLMRYWAMTATYDAVAFSLLVWVVSLVVVGFSLTPDATGREACFWGGLVLAIASFYALRRGAKYYRYQVEDLAAHFATSKC